MTNDNYRTTAAALVDAPEPQRPPRPRSVNYALGLIAGALLIQLIAVLLALRDSNFYFANPRGMALVAADFVLVGLIGWQIAQGRHWARLVLLILMLVNFARICWAVGYVWRQAPEAWDVLLGADYLLTRLLPLVMYFVALHLVYFSSGDWFRSRGQSPS